MNPAAARFVGVYANCAGGQHEGVLPVAADGCGQTPTIHPDPQTQIRRQQALAAVKSDVRVASHGQRSNHT
jgi:hypothetical protein